MRSGGMTFLSMQALVFVQLPLAYADGFLTVSGMQNQGYSVGIPLIWHFGIWGDLIVVSPLASYIVARYSSQWRASHIFTIIAAATVVTAFFGWLYTTGAAPGSHAREHHTTLAGYIHLLYMVTAIAIFGLFYLCSEVPSRVVIIVTPLLVIHVFFGTHLALGVLAKFTPLPWYPHPTVGDLAAWITLVAVGLVLGWRTYHLSIANFQRA